MYVLCMCVCMYACMYILCLCCMCAVCCRWLAKSERHVVLLDCKCFGYEHIFLGVYQKFGMKVSYLHMRTEWRQQKCL